MVFEKWWAKMSQVLRADNGVAFRAGAARETKFVNCCRQQSRRRAQPAAGSFSAQLALTVLGGIVRAHFDNWDASPTQLGLTLSLLHTSR